jgi:hypothetical protein
VAVNWPCLLHLAIHPAGVTWTTIRRAQWTQYRGGSTSASRALHFSCSVSCPGSWSGLPQQAQYTIWSSIVVTTSRSGP